MKRKHLFVALTALLVACGLWLARTARRSDDSTFDKTRTMVGAETSSGGTQSTELSSSPARLAPPDPTRRFREFTPEQRVEFARKGHGPGG